MRSRGVLAFTVVVAAVAAAAWFVVGGGGHDAPGGAARRGTTRTPEEAVPAADARAPGAAAAPDSDAAAQRTIDPAAPSAVSPRDILGRVVDGRRVGVAGARVRFSPKDRDALEVVSREGGAFEFTVASVGPSHLQGMLHAVGPDGSMGTSYIALAADPEAAAAPERDGDRERVVLTILPPARLVVHVRDEQGPVAGARVAAELSSIVWVFGAARLPAVATDATGTAVLEVPPCDATVVATVPGRATASQWTTCESGIEQTIDLVLHPTCSVTIRVRDAQTHAPVAGAFLVFNEPILDRPSREFSYSPPHEIWFTGCVPDVACDDAGVAHLDEVDPNRRRSVTARAPGYGHHDRDRMSLDGTNREIELLLTPRPAHDVRVPIIAGELPVPPDGTVVKLRPQDYGVAGVPDSATVAQGELVFTYDADERRTAVATAPDGSCGVFPFGGAQPSSPLQFHRPRTLTLRLRFADGRSAPHAAIVLTDHGMQGPSTRQADDEGRIVCRGLLASPVQVLDTGANAFASPLASIDLRAGDVEADVVVRERCEARLAVTIDGKPGLPPTFRLSRPDGEIRVDAEDPERGELRVSTRTNATDREIKVWFVARSFPPATFQLPVVHGGEPPVVPVALTHGAQLLLEVRRAAKQKIALRIQRLGADAKFANLELQSSAVDRVDGPRGTFTFGPLEAGTWRVLDEVTSIATDPFVLASGERRAAILDLANALLVHGHVTVPDGTNLGLVRIVARGESLEVPPNQFGQHRYPGTGVNGDGTFERTVDDANPFVRAWHPSLAPPLGDPFVEVRDPTRAVELTLVDRPSLTFTIVRPDGAVFPHMGPSHEGLLAVVLDREDGDRAHSTRSFQLFGAATEVVKLAEIPAGRWTVFLDPGGELAPVFRTGVDIPEAGRDLGEVTIGGGSAVRLQISDTRKNTDTSFNLSARHVGAPEYSRWWQRAVGPELLLPGLGAGRFELTLCNSLGKDLWTGTIEADGAHETVLAVELH